MNTLTLSFDDKVQALALISVVGFNRAVNLFARTRRVPPVRMREELHVVHSTNSITEVGVVELTSANFLQFVMFNCPQQPKALTKELFSSFSEEVQDDVLAACAKMRCSHLIQDFKSVRVNSSNPFWEKKREAMAAQGK